MYFVCDVRRIPVPGFLATFCATVDSEVDGIEDLDLLPLLMLTRIIKNIFNKSKRCRDVKTQKAGKQGWKANIGPKIKQTTSI